MSDYNIGPGIAQAIADNGAEARSDEIYIIMDEGERVSRVFATDGVYYYYERDNKTQRTPF